AQRWPTPASASPSPDRPAGASPAGVPPRPARRTGRAVAGAGGRPRRGKRAKGRAARRLEEKRRRQRTLLWTGVAVVSLVALVALIVFIGRENPPAANKPGTAEALQAGRQAAGSQGVKTFPSAGRNHIGADRQPSNWNS